MIRALLLLVLCASCDLSMKSQPRDDTQAQTALWPGGPPIAPTPADAVAFAAGPSQPRPRLTLALVQRGQNRYAIYCSACHGASGAGDGPVVGRGFPAPRPFAAASGQSAAQLFAATTNGAGVMYGFGDRLSADDRWAVVAYIRALQRADAKGAP